MITEEDVEKFLENFYVKVKIFGIRFRDDRDKNRNALLDLEISPRMRETVVMSLEWKDYLLMNLIMALKCGCLAKIIATLRYTSKSLWENPTRTRYAYHSTKLNILCLTH